MRRRMAPRRHCHPGVAALSNAKPRSATRSTFRCLWTFRNGHATCIFPLEPHSGRAPPRRQRL